MTNRRPARLAFVIIASLVVLASAFAPATAIAQVLIGETSARFDWPAASGDVEFYQVIVSRSSNGGTYEYEQTVTSNSAIVDGDVGEVVRVRVRAGNAIAFGPFSNPSQAVRLGLPSQLPVLGTAGVLRARASGSDLDVIFHADPASPDVWRFSAVDATAPPTLIGSEPDPGWTAVASGDFDGDTVADLLWRHTDGSTRIWFLFGDSYQEELGPLHPGDDWAPEVTGDFDGNGQDDLLWRQDAGAIQVWLRADADFTTSPFPGMPSDIEMLASGDFDGDGMDDVIWRDVTTTETLIWFMTVDPWNGAYASTTASESRSLLWEVFETRDHDADGRDDIRWRMADSHDITQWWLMGAGGVTATD